MATPGAIVTSGGLVTPGGDQGPPGGSSVLADATQNGLMRQVSGNTTDFVDGTNHCQDLATSPSIGLMRLRSFNAIGNPNFEVDQRNAGAAVGSTASYAVWTQDRWYWSFGASGFSATASIGSELVYVPGTSFLITQKYRRLLLNTNKATLAAGDYFFFNQNVEGPILRELFGGVHSIALLVRSSVAALSFGLIFRDPSATVCLCKLCTVPNANAWTYIPLPNLPTWVGGGSWSTAPGAVGYVVGISLAAGSTYTSPANDTWQTFSNCLGAVGQSNWLASPVNSTFDIAFVQHEPGPYCTQFIDLDFQTNLWRCQRYYQKNLPYVTRFPVVSATTGIGTHVGNTATGRLFVPFTQIMAKNPPTVTFAGSAGNLNQMFIDAIGDVNVSSVTCNDSRMFQSNLTGNVGTGGIYYPISACWQADTGW